MQVLLGGPVRLDGCPMEQTSNPTETRFVVEQVYVENDLQSDASFAMTPAFVQLNHQERTCWSAQKWVCR